MAKYSVFVLAVSFLVVTSLAEAANYPCSGKKGGVSHCMGSLFICNDGSASQSKRNCSAEGFPSKANNERIADDDQRYGAGGMTKRSGRGKKQ